MRQTDRIYTRQDTRAAYLRGLTAGRRQGREEMREEAAREAEALIPADPFPGQCGCGRAAMEAIRALPVE